MQMLKILRLLKKIGLLNSYLLNGNVMGLRKVKVSPFFYKNSAFFKNIKLVTTPAKRFNIKLKTLQIVCKSLGESIIILETSKGILTHKEALKLRISGKVLLVLS
jgi:ribosomal protein S8